MVKHESDNLVSRCHLSGEAGVSCFWETSGLGWAEQGVYLPLLVEHQLPHGSLWRGVAVTGSLTAY